MWPLCYWLAVVHTFVNQPEGEHAMIAPITLLAMR
ncbi:Uncharacterised protein [Citrobacter koseri]|uniref:Uncharacterized protein n=1 Tax=Citrobacter koseri TaxID=545 RepID=A0A2X2UTQ5_CITKO|nr:Uncharacterised protein [Citrobacter koseri]